MSSTSASATSSEDPPVDKEEEEEEEATTALREQQNKLFLKLQMEQLQGRLRQSQPPNPQWNRVLALYSNSSPSSTRPNDNSDPDDSDDKKKESANTDNTRADETKSKASLSDVPSLPSFTTHEEKDYCIKEEKLARAKRIEVIMKLSEEEKAKEAERIRVANIRPFSWPKPTFSYPSSSSSTATASAAAAASSHAPQASQEASSWKRKERYDCFGCNRFYERRQPTEEELQMLSDFMNKWFPPAPPPPCNKRQCTDADDSSGGDN
jgi:hypothetical protein